MTDLLLWILARRLKLPDVKLSSKTDVEHNVVLTRMFFVSRQHACFSFCVADDHTTIPVLSDQTLYSEHFQNFPRHYCKYKWINTEDKRYRAYKTKMYRQNIQFGQSLFMICWMHTVCMEKEQSSDSRVYILQEIGSGAALVDLLDLRAAAAAATAAAPGAACSGTGTGTSTAEVCKKQRTVRNRTCISGRDRDSATHKKNRHNNINTNTLRQNRVICKFKHDLHTRHSAGHAARHSAAGCAALRVQPLHDRVGDRFELLLFVLELVLLGRLVAVEPLDGLVDRFVQRILVRLLRDTRWEDRESASNEFTNKNRYVMERKGPRAHPRKWFRMTGSDRANNKC